MRGTRVRWLRRRLRDAVGYYTNGQWRAAKRAWKRRREVPR